MNNTKSDEEFETQHLRIKTKIFNDLKESKNRYLNKDRTTTYLNNWNRNVKNKKKLIEKIKHKTRNMKCTTLERDMKNRTQNRKVNFLNTARNRKCVQQEFYGIPKYIKQNELFIKSCQAKNRHDSCQEEYINKQLEINDATDLTEVNKYPSFDKLIVIGQKIEREKCINKNTREELTEETIDLESEECHDEQEEDIDSVAFEICSNVFQSFDPIPIEDPKNVILDFIENLVACNIVKEILDSIIDDIFDKYNIYYLKMKFSAHRFEVISEVFENEMDNSDSLLETVFEQLSELRKFSQVNIETQPQECDFTRNSDYMLQYIENKNKFIFQKEENLPKVKGICLNNINEVNQKLIKENRIKSYLYNVLLSMDDNVKQLERSIGIINGYKEKTPGRAEGSQTNNTNTKSIERQSVVSYRSKANMSKISQMNKNKEIAILRESQLQKKLQTEVRNSNLFRDVLTLQFRYIILDAIDYVCEVLNS